MPDPVRLTQALPLAFVTAEAGLSVPEAVVKLTVCPAMTAPNSFFTSAQICDELLADRLEGVAVSVMVAGPDM